MMIRGLSNPIIYTTNEGDNIMNEDMNKVNAYEKAVKEGFTGTEKDYLQEIVNQTSFFPLEKVQSESDIDEIIKSAKEAADNNEDISHLREIQETPNENTEVTAVKQSFMVKPDGKPDFTRAISTNGQLPEADVGLDELDKIVDINDAKMTNNIQNSAAGFDLTNEEAENIAKILILYKNNKHMNVYGEMIPSMKNRINKLCFESSIPISEANTVAKYMMDQFLTTASEDEEFIDIEKSIEKAMKIPSLIDMYTEHVNETMNVRLPTMAEEIRKTDPDKADMLMKVCDQYNNAFLFSRLRNLYDSNARIRKAVRKNYKIENINKLCANVNYFNGKTQFKMPDTTTLLGILTNLLKDDKEIYPADICKFVTLILESISYLNLDDIIDTTYMYYLLKNISMLSYVGDAKSNFSAELISNIRVTMYYIRIREDEFDARNSVHMHTR